MDNVPLIECSYGQQNGQYALRVEKFIATPPETGSGDVVAGGKNV
nr:hypothetical protein [Azonexus hydrophilus]